MADNRPSMADEPGTQLEEDTAMMRNAIYAASRATSADGDLSSRRFRTVVEAILTGSDTQLAAIEALALELNQG